MIFYQLSETGEIVSRIEKPHFYPNLSSKLLLKQIVIYAENRWLMYDDPPYLFDNIELISLKSIYEIRIT